MVGAVISRLGLSQTSFRTVAADIIATHILVWATEASKANLLLSGGSTPGPIYEVLSELGLPWKDVAVGLVDERWVGENDNGSNAALIRKTLMQGKAKAAQFIPMKTVHASPQDGQQNIEAQYKNLISGKSLAVLGMGTDGHVCSWFPQSYGLDAAIDPVNKNVVQAITANKSKVTGDYLERMTLTLSALKQCRSVLLLITGAEKREVLETAMNNQSSNLPVAHLLKLKNLTILHAA